MALCLPANPSPNAQVVCSHLSAPSVQIFIQLSGQGSLVESNQSPYLVLNTLPSSRLWCKPAVEIFTISFSEIQLEYEERKASCPVPIPSTLLLCSPSSFYRNGANRVMVIVPVYVDGAMTEETHGGVDLVRRRLRVVEVF